MGRMIQDSSSGIACFMLWLFMKGQIHIKISLWLRCSDIRDVCLFFYYYYCLHCYLHFMLHFGGPQFMYFKGADFKCYLLILFVQKVWQNMTELKPIPVQQFTDSTTANTSTVLPYVPLNNSAIYMSLWHLPLMTTNAPSHGPHTSCNVSLITGT